ncbi:MAG: DUF6817 domain-containing protein [Planctomycetota bacterium]|jgi:hypothetical protein
MATFKELTDFFQEVGATDVSHTKKSYLAHAIGVYNDMKKCDDREELAHAAMFHSIYGTERFQRFKLDLERRDDVRALIGDRAEWLAWLNCAMDREAYDACIEALIEDDSAPLYLVDRFSGERLNLSCEDFDDLGKIHLVDWLEQVGRSQDWTYRRAIYEYLARRLGSGVETSFDEVYAGQG